MLKSGARKLTLLAMIASSLALSTAAHAAVTVLGTYHDKPCIEHANVVPFRPPQISQQPDEGFEAEVDEFSSESMGADSGLGHA
jgi:hypothetical protein